jgi:CRP/FNR family transcriptional regulator, anaerobic regulatory protein
MHNDTTPAARGFPDHTAGGQRQWIRRNASLYCSGDPVADCVFFIHAGSFKHYRTDETGARKITCFPARGDFLALDSIGLDRHPCTAVALEDSEVYAISYAILRQQLSILHHLLALGIREMRAGTVQMHQATAEQRLAAFLLDRARRHTRLEGTTPRYRLPMSRCDIANHLHLSPESVSRVMHQFKQAGLISVENRYIGLLDASAMETIATAAHPASASPHADQPPFAIRHTSTS